MISIPDPCNEDFSKMSPTERGAFCEVCSIDTFDFRSLNNTQIIDILEDHKGKHICGRFNKSQLDEINSMGYSNWKNQSRKTFQSKFVLACLLVFGMTLFSCESEQAEQIESLNVEQVTQTVDPQIAYINKHVHPEILEVDLLDYIIEPDIVEPIYCEISGDIAYETYTEIAGGLRYEEVVDTVMYNHPIELGGAVVIDHEIDEIKVTQNVEKENISIGQIFTSKVFPNPTQTESTLQITVENEGQFDIVLYDLNGQMVTSVYSGHLNQGRQTFKVDLTNENAGLYLIKVISQGQNETVKIQKIK